MGNQKYEIEKHSVDTILSWIKTKEVVIPEIQRPFVWKAVQVRNLIDSLYNGYPVGYLIVSRSHDLKLKDGTISKGQRILIDGQQRVTALTAAILGRTVLNKEYQERPIRIAYNPFAKEEENAFEVQDQSHLKSKRWIDDISIFFDDNFFIKTILSTVGFIRHYHNISTFGQWLLATLELEHRGEDDAVCFSAIQQLA